MSLELLRSCVPIRADRNEFISYSKFDKVTPNAGSTTVHDLKTKCCLLIDNSAVIEYSEALKFHFDFNPLILLSNPEPA